MHGVTAALVAFLLLCIAFPQMIRNRTQYYAAFGLICGIILLDAAGLAVGGKFAVVMYFIAAILQIGAICVLFLAAGGITWKDLGGEMGHALEVIRRGEEEKEIIVPLRGEVPKRKEDAADEPAPATPPAPASANPPPPPGGTIPLE